MKSILYVGVDVDDKNFHGAGTDIETGDLYEFKTKPNLGSLLKKLNQLEDKGYELKVCYEASYIGYNLCRDLIKKGIKCEIIASSLIPQKPGDKIKTDKLDCRKLSEYYGKNLLTTIYIPDEKDEQVRDMIRSRIFLVKQRSGLKQHILSLCRRYRLNYKEETQSKSYWTKNHLEWLRVKINELSDIIKSTFEILIYQLDKYEINIKEIEDKIKNLSNEEIYKEKTEALNCFRGLNTLSSMTVITELGDIKRFSHPAKLTSYVGLDIVEYTSGKKEKKYGITKMGNCYIRTVVIEACQNILKCSSRISRRLMDARKNKEKKIIDIAERCNARLKKKANRMYFSGKHKNVIKVACAREYLSFIWEVLQYVS